MNRSHATRRTVLTAGALAATLGVAGRAAWAQAAGDWRAKYPTLVYAQGTNENASTKTELLGPFVEYLGKKLGVKVQLRIGPAGQGRTGAHP